MQHQNAISAIKRAAQLAPAIVGWKSGGWVVYDPCHGAPEGVQPEILVGARGRVPLALSDTGAAVLRSAIAATISNA